MSLQKIMPGLIALLILSVIGMAASASAGLPLLTGACAVGFALPAVVVALLTNRPYWRSEAALHAVALRRNARLTALICMWAALAMLSMYTTQLTGLRWQHGWQYALGFALLAVAAFWHAHRLGGDAVRRGGAPGRYAAPLAAAQAVAAGSGLAFLVGSGKLASTRPDWAANWVFLCASLALMLVGAIALRTHMRLTRIDGEAPSGS